jgi:hypothetical protein
MRSMVGLVELGGMLRLARKMRSASAHIALGAQQVVAGLGVARLGQPRQRVDADVLDALVLGHAAPPRPPGWRSGRTAGRARA